MSRYVLERTDQGGGYVTPRGSSHSYTKDLRCAMVWTTREEAEADRCVENERVVDLAELLRPSDNMLAQGLQGN